MALFDRLAAALFGAQPSADAGLVAEMIEAVVDAVEPKVRMHSRYRHKLEPHIRQSIEHLRALAREPLEPVLLSRAAWASDPRVNAFFATAADVRLCLGRANELRSFLDQPANAALQEAYALLGMKKEERSVLGMALRGDAVQRDVAQTQISFTGHRIIAPSETLAATHLEVGRRILLRLAQVSLMRILEADAKATELQSRKAYLGSRLRLLRLAEDGMEGIVKDHATIAAEMKAVERELTQTVEGYIAAKASAATIEGYLQQIADVFSRPQEHVSLVRTPLRVSRLGVRVEGDSQESANELSLAEIVIGEFRAAIAIVRCPRAEIPSKEELIAQAERSL
jgi:hypothetical protein